MDPMTALTIVQARNAAQAAVELGLELPATVADALAVLDAAEGFDAGGAPDPIDFDTATPDAVVEYLTRATELELRRGVLPGIRGWVVGRLGLRLTRSVRAAGAAWINALGPRFGAAGATFAELHAELVPNYSEAAALVAAGPGAVEHYQRAQEAALELTRLAAFRDGLAHLGLTAKGCPRDVEIGSRHIEVTSRAGAEKVAEAMRAGGPLAPWGPILDLGPEVVRRLRWLEPADHEGELRALPAGLEGDLVVREDGFVGPYVRLKGKVREVRV